MRSWFYHGAAYVEFNKRVSFVNKYVSEDWPISTHADPMATRRAIFHERRISSVTFTSAQLYGNVYIPVGVARALAEPSDFGLLGEQSSQKCEIPCLWRRLTAKKNFDAAVFIIGGEIRNRTSTHTNTQTNGKRYIHTSPIGVCV